MSRLANPPAFPNTGNSTWNLEPADGMTLRDWFAGQVSPTLLASKSLWKITPGPEVPATVARFAYDIADAMLTERAKEPRS